MESFPEQRLNALQADPKPGCGRAGCACGLPVSERFVLWALRQWQQDRALPAEGSILHRGFKMAGLLEVLPDFAIAMDAFLFGARRTMADAMYAPVVTRFMTYDVKLEPKLAAYAKTIMAMPEMQEWIEAAKAEPADIEELEVEY